MPNIFDQFWFTGYESAYFNSDMGLYQEYLGALEELKVKKLRGIVSQDSEIAPENQLVYNEATTRLMDYDSYLNNLGTNIWERYAQIHPLMNPPVNNVPDRTNAVTSAVELNISDQPMVPGGQSATLTNNDSNQPNDGVNDITTQPKVEQWNARYKNLIIEIANSSPERREQLIREHQPELNKFQDSKINVKNDLEYLRNVQDHLNAKLAGRDSAFVKNFYYNVEIISGPTNTAFVDAECSDEDSELGYTLEPNENNVLWRVNSAGIPHPDDLDKFFEQKRVIQLAFNKTVEESTLEPEIRAMTPQESFQWGFSRNASLVPFLATDAASTELKDVQGLSKTETNYRHYSLREIIDTGLLLSPLGPEVKLAGVLGLGLKEINVLSKGSSKAEELAQFAKLNEVKQLPVNFDKILEFSGGNMDLAKRLLLSTKEALPGKTIPELVETFKLTETPAVGSLSGYQTRIWYKWQESLIGSRLDYSKPLEEVARDAFNMRNSLRTTAREAMTDTEWSKYLMSQERNKTFEQLVEENMGKGLSGDALWNKIIESSMKSRDYVDKLFDL